MSIANQILDSKYLGHYLDRTPDGRTRISRQWEITADKTNPSELEALLFQQHGTPDGVDNSRHAFTPNSEKVFCNAYLTEQYVRSQGRGVAPNLYTLTKVYEEADETLRLLTTPTYRSDENGRRYASASYIVLTSAWEDEEKSLAGEVGVTTFSKDDNTFVLSEEESSSEGFVLTTVTREWLEVTETPQQIGKTGHFRGPDGILRHSQQFIQLASAEEELGEIGVDVLDGTGALLFTQRSESTEVVRTITKEYVEPGILSESEEESSNGALTIRTVQAFAVEVDEPKDFVEVSVSTTNPNGYPIRTYRFAKGEGMVSRDIDEKLGGALTITIERHLSKPDDATGPSPLPGEFAREYREESGYRIWTIRGAVGTGVIEDNSQTRYGGKLTVRTILSLNTPVHAAGEIDFSANVRDGYTLFTSKGVSGSGRFYEKTTSREAGLVDVFTIRFVNSDDGDAPDGVLISTESEQHEGFTIFTESYVLASSSGTISTQTQTRYNGALTLTTIRAINTEPVGPAGSVLVSTQTQTADGYTNYTSTFASGSGVFSTETSTRFGTKLTLTTIRSINVPPAAPAGAALVSTQVQEGDGYTIYTSVFASGSGRISVSTTSRQNSKLTLTTIRFLNADDTTKPDGVLISSSTSQDAGYVLIEETYAAGEGRISTSESFRHGTKLRLTTVRFLDTDDGTKPDGVLIATSSTSQDGYTVIEETYADGEGRISTSPSSRYGTKLTVTTIRFLNSDDAAKPVGVKIASSVTQADGYTIFEETYADGEGRISTDTSDRYNKKLTITKIRFLEADDGDTPDGVLIGSSSTESDGYTIYEETYADGEGRISTSPSSRYGTKLTVTTIRFLNADDEAKPAGAKIASSVTQADGYTVIEETYASGAGRISTSPSDRFNEKLTLTAIRFLNTDDETKPDGILVSSSVTRQDGYDLIEETYASGAGRVSEETSHRFSGAAGGTGLIATTIRFLNTDDDDKPDGFKVSSSSREADGYTLFEETYISGSGTFAESVTTSLGDKLTTTTRRGINEEPTAPTGDYVVLVRDETREADGYTIHEKTWKSGSGLIDDKTEPRADGSQIYRVTSLNEQASGSPPTGSYLINSDVEPGDGYLIYTDTYYLPPTDYTMPVQLEVTKPGLVNADSSGIVIARLAQHVSVSATATVTFTASPSLPSITPISPGAVVYEQADFDDGKSPEYLYDETTLHSYYAGTGFVAPSGEIGRASCRGG